MSSEQLTIADRAHGAEIGQVARPVPSRSRIVRLVSAMRITTVAVVLFAVAVSLQWLTGAFTAEFSGYPDEASHYMSGLLVHDYVAAGLPAGPMRFAQNFYLHYPYLAIGHWPPFFYAIEGAWMLLFSPARVSVMLLMALITTLLALTTYILARAEFGVASAWMISILLICNPLVLQYTSMVMLETSLALLSLGAVVCFGRFLDSGRWQDSAKFAAFASLAILTKANGFELALVPPLCLLACRRINLVVRPSFWIPAAAVGLLCLPWHFATMHLILPTFTAKPGVSFTTQATGFYTGNVVKMLGLGLLALVALGFADRIIRPFLARRVEGKWAALAALPLSVIAFHSVVSAGLERRYLVTTVAPILLFAAAGAKSAAERLRVGTVKLQWKQQVLLLAATLIFANMSFVMPAKISYGFKEAANRIVSSPDFRNSLILVSSETNVGEGIFVSEMAMRDHAFHHLILRASKVLAENAWNQSIDDKYTPIFANAEELTKCLQEIPLGAVIIDSSLGPKRYQHHQELLQVMESHSDNWILLGSFNRDEQQGSRGVDLYSFAGDRNHSEGQDPIRQIRTNLTGGLQSWPISMRLSCHTGVQATRSGVEQ